MPTYPVPHDHWQEAFDRFSLSHFAWPVSVEIVPPMDGAQPAVVELPLNTISVTGSEIRPAVAISMSQDVSGHFTHLVEDVEDVFVQREGNVDSAIEIVASDGTRTILRCTLPAPRVVSGTVH